ncbi:MAG: glycogen-binding domain-containing protein [Gemmatimonadaceae bacterium]
MLNHPFARPLRRAIFVGASAVGVCAAITPASAFAQLRASWDANAAVSQYDSPRITTTTPTTQSRDPGWLGVRAIGGALRFNNPFLQFNADGVVRDGDVTTHATGGASALAASPSWNGLRISATANVRHVPNDGLSNFKYDPFLLASWAPPPVVPTWQSNVAASVSYARNSAGVWLRANSRQGAGTGDSLSRWAFASGLNYQLRSVVLGLSMGMQHASSSSRWSTTTLVAHKPVQTDTGPKVDSATIFTPQTDSGFTNAWKRWSEAAATVGWASGRFALDAMLAARPRLGNSRAATWGEASGTVAVTSRVALVASMRTSPQLPGVPFAERRVASVGLRVAPPSFWRPAPPSPIRSASRSFNVKASAPGEYTITLSVPNARSVELAGDFTAWKAVTLRQVNATRWEIVLKVDPGSHRCNVRIDGADWVAPPGVPAVNDEFNGRVGLFVAE